MTRLLELVGVLCVLCFIGCNRERGERCNPLLFEDECGSGLSCQYPTNCAVAVCCPPSGMTNANVPPGCSFVAGCVGPTCCPTTPVSTPNPADPCLPCILLDAGTAD
jgi:hypothetical protein